jgi:FkbM family methyltransferase
MIAAIAEAALRRYSLIAPGERGGFRLARLVRRLRPRQRWCDTFITPDGLRLNLDLATYPDVSMAYGLYELDTARLIKKLLKPGDHFVDAGANLGYFTLLAAKLVGPGGRVDAFEPHPLNRARLLDHLRANNIQRGVTVHGEALADQSGIATMHMPPPGAGNHGEASLFGEGEALEVPTVRLDEALAGTHPTLIKVDVEGAEPLAVAGMSSLVKVDHPPAIIAEYNVDTARRARFAPREFVNRLLQLQPNYRVEIVGSRRSNHSLDQRLANRAVANLLFTAAA